MPRRNMGVKIDKNMKDRQQQHTKDTSKTRVQKRKSKKEIITEADTRIDKDYQEGFLPSAHQKVLTGFIKAVGGVGKRGEINLQRQVLDEMEISRSSVLRVIPYLMKYGYIKYEARPEKHCSYVHVLKGFNN